VHVGPWSQATFAAAATPAATEARHHFCESEDDDHDQSFLRSQNNEQTAHIIARQRIC